MGWERVSRVGGGIMKMTFRKASSCSSKDTDIIINPNKNADFSVSNTEEFEFQDTQDLRYLGWERVSRVGGGIMRMTFRKTHSCSSKDTDIICMRYGKSNQPQQKGRFFGI